LRHETADQRAGGQYLAFSRVRLIKILDIFEGTQQIQQVIVARRLLGKTSAELKYACPHRIHEGASSRSASP